MLAQHRPTLLAATCCDRLNTPGQHRTTSKSNNVGRCCANIAFSRFWLVRSRKGNKVGKPAQYFPLTQCVRVWGVMISVEVNQLDSCTREASWLQARDLSGHIYLSWGVPAFKGDFPTSQPMLITCAEPTGQTLQDEYCGAVSGLELPISICHGRWAKFLFLFCQYFVFGDWSNFLPFQLKGSVKQRCIYLFRFDFSSCSESAELACWLFLCQKMSLWFFFHKRGKEASNTLLKVHPPSPPPL